MSKRIYLDNAATTEMLPEVTYAMEPYFIKRYGNASAVYELGAEAKNAIELAREQVAASIMAKPSEIFFTSGGSESDNWAIKNTAGERTLTCVSKIQNVNLPIVPNKLDVWQVIL